MHFLSCSLSYSLTHRDAQKDDSGLRQRDNMPVGQSVPSKVGRSVSHCYQTDSLCCSWARSSKEGQFLSSPCFFVFVFFLLSHIAQHVSCVLVTNFIMMIITSLKSLKGIDLKENCNTSTISWRNSPALI